MEKSSFVCCPLHKDVKGVQVLLPLISIQCLLRQVYAVGVAAATSAAPALLSPFAFPECLFVPKKGSFPLLELQLKTSVFSAVDKTLPFEKLFSFY